ncbi:MAG: hypothetical protein IKO41_05565 [Lachnospiraceae bacterium]|nr:hypothetical protein [Lachnospiraceae bacterium]
MGKEVVWQNKDVTSKVMAEQFKEKTLNVYGLDVPKIVQVLPTNLPEISANELRIDNLFLLEDGTLAIIDYESAYEESDKVKYLQYVARVLERYRSEGKLKVKIRMIVIYTADVREEQVNTVYDTGALKMEIQPAFLSKLDSENIMKRLRQKVESGERLTDEEMMEFIILPLTYRGKEAKKAAVNEMISLAKGIHETAVLRFVLAGIIVFADKIIDIETGEEVAKRIMMTKVDMIFQERTDRAVAEALEKAAEENRAAMEQVMVEVRKEKAKVKTEKEKVKAEKEKAKVEKEQAIFAYIRDMQEGGAAKGTVLEKLMLIFRLSKKNAERYYEKA